MQAQRARMTRIAFTMLLLAGACERPLPPRQPAGPLRTTGAAARELLAHPEFSWRTAMAPHARLHTHAGSRVEEILPSLADSIEAARLVALRTLGEADVPGERLMELFLVDTREDMRRLAGRPIGGFAQPGELTAAFVAGPGYRPFLRHELTHALAAVRWGPMRSGNWLTEGLATFAEGPCQGHSVDALAAGYLAAGEIPPLRELADRYREFSELPANMSAASVVGFLSRERGIAAVRDLWTGTVPGVRTEARAGVAPHPLGVEGDSLERVWRQSLARVAPARLDSARLRRDGC